MRDTFNNYFVFIGLYNQISTMLLQLVLYKLSNENYKFEQIKVFKKLLINIVAKSLFMKTCPFHEMSTDNEIKK